MNGGSGVDSVDGGAGADILVLIDELYADTADGGQDKDVLWLDNAGQKDLVKNSTSGDVIHRVAKFSNSADRTMNGDEITDPSSQYHTHRFQNLSLFAGDTPRASDVDQGSLGDCWLLSALGETAMKQPQLIKQNIVSFGDGTFGVHLGSNYYRLDSDLPVFGDGSGKDLAYAKLGNESAAWVPLYEKAFAYHRNSTTDQYTDLVSGHSITAFAALGMETQSVDVSWPMTADSLVMGMYAKWSNGYCMTVSSLKSDSSLLIDSHAYMVAGFTRSALTGLFTHVTLRNPHGSDGGNTKDSNPDDGLVTLTVSQLFANIRRVSYGWI